MGTRYKVFVWDNVLEDYTSGGMFAVAKNVSDARAALLKECSYIPESDLGQEPKVYDITDCPARAVWGGG